MDDRELLREYVERQSEKAFSELVARHVNLVYATALRVVGEPAAAQDVVQTVFILLARKAWTVRDGNALLGWLYRAAYRAALDAARSDQRRRQRETEAMILTEQNSTSPEAWEKLAPLLDEAMQRLNRAEQDAVLLRYFEGKTLRETGAALGVSEPAAQMRVSRALDKMRAHFARGGVTVAAGALATVLATNTGKAAPVDLAARVTGPSLAGAGSSGIGATLLKILYMSTKTKVILAVVILTIIGTTITISLQSPDRPNAAVLPVQLPAPKPPAVSASVTGGRPAILAGIEASAAVVGQKKLQTTAPAPSAKSANPGVVGLNKGARQSLDTAIPEAIRLLEAQDTVGFYKEFVPADQRANLPPGMTVEQMDEAMRQDPTYQQQMDTILQLMRSIQGQTPVLDGVGEKATYTIPNPPKPGPTQMFFVKVDGLWYFHGFEDN
jgi:RNA polymerase sigma factor (sigma-70 family)